MVFEDSTGSRWKRALLIAGGLCAIAVFLAADLAVSIAYDPKLPRLDDVASNSLVTIEPLVECDSLVEAASHPTPSAASGRSHSALTRKQFLRTAFLVQDDAPSIASLKSHINALDIVFPDWFAFSTDDGTVRESVRPSLAAFLLESGVDVYPRLANTDEQGNWHEDEFTQILQDDEVSHQFINTLVEKVLKAHAQGINIDIERVNQEDKDNYVNWLEDLVKAFHEHKLRIIVDLPMNDEVSFDYEAIGQLADAVIVMGYDQHYPGGKAGPIAANDWFNEGFEDMVGRIAPAKILAGIGAYGYDWNLTTGQEAQSLSFMDVMTLAKTLSARVDTESESVNSRFRYEDPRGGKHEVWFLDAVSAWNELLAARSCHCRGMALWRLGQEDPGLWDALCTPTPDQAPTDALECVRTQQTLVMRGQGEMLDVRCTARDGRRSISLSGQAIDWAGYERLPDYFDVQSMGHSATKKVALTFDDGPNPQWTPRILSILKQNNVKATFFVIGDNVDQYPQLVKQEAQAGHMLGNHTYTHPDIQTVSDTRLRMELTGLQRLLESITGRQTLLFRPPFGIDSPPLPGELSRMYVACQSGYLMVSADIDPADYSKPGVDTIVERTIQGLEKTGSSVVLMHDGGGDRSQTAAAVALLIPRLKAMGYKFVTIDNLVGMSRDKLMPPVSLSERVLSLGAQAWMVVRGQGWSWLVALFFLTTGISIFRILLITFFTLRPRRAVPDRPDFCPEVLVLVPAFNEVRVIQRTLEAVLRNDYSRFSVMVIDDGSTDGTGDLVEEMARRDGRIRLLRKANGGKHSALNLGFRTASEEIIVTIDADTYVCPHTIRQLVLPFADENIDAVCGNVQVGNVTNVITAFQNVEYITSQNYDRRAFDALNCISVVPGATGAWRREKVLAIGGYSPQTLTEDADLTLSMLAAGGRIVCAPKARSRTEAPETAKTLFRQRFRWSYGTFQCLWKHRRHFGRGTMGLVAMPNILIFQLFFPIVSPIGDFVLLLSLLRGDAMAIWSGYLLFLALDFVASLIAFRLDRKPLRQMWVILIQRFYYRQFMYIVAWKAALAAIKGSRHHWNKLDRQGSVAEVVPAPKTATL